MTKNELNQLIEADLYRVYGAKGKKQLIKSIIKNPGFKYMYTLRKCQYFRERSKIILKIYYLLLKHYQYKYGIEIPYGTSIGKGFYIGHIGSITINEKAIIGNNVNILKGILIGYNPRGEKEGCPIIGDRVWIGPNSIIVGKVKVGNDVLIAPGAFINFDVPDNSIVIGNPGKIIPKDDSVEKYINYTT